MSNAFYGDNLRWFTGRVVKTGDKYGRVQIFIYGIHDDIRGEIAVEDLPWAATVLPTTEGGTSGFGKNSYLQTNAAVFGFFLDGELSQHPIVIGSLGKVEFPSETQYFQANLSGTLKNRSYQDLDDIGKDGIFSPTYLKNIVTEDSVASKTFAAMEILVTNGLPPRSAAGVVGNLLGENSTLDPKLQGGVSTSQVVDPQFPTQTVTQNPGKEPAWGIAQWNASANVRRWQTLEKIVMGLDWPKAGDISDPEKKNPLNFFTQMEYLIYDMKNAPYLANNGQVYTGGNHRCWNHLSNPKNFDYDRPGVWGDPESEQRNPTHHFLHVFEMGSAKKYYGQSDIEEREKNARQALKFYNDSLEQAASTLASI
jgi:hypothetical protein